MSPPKAVCSRGGFLRGKTWVPVASLVECSGVDTHVGTHPCVVCVHAHACVCARAGLRLPVGLSREHSSAGALFLPSCPVVPPHCGNTWAVDWLTFFELKEHGAGSHEPGSDRWTDRQVCPRALDSVVLGATGGSWKQSCPPARGRQNLRVRRRCLSRPEAAELQSWTGLWEPAPASLPCGRGSRGSGGPSDPRQAPGTPWTPVSDVQQPDGPPQACGLSAQDADGRAEDWAAHLLSQMGESFTSAGKLSTKASGTSFNLSQDGRDSGPPLLLSLPNSSLCFHNNY